MNISGRRFLIFTIAAILSLLCSGCDGQKPDAGLPSILRIGVLPDESAEKVSVRYEPLRKFLSETLGIPCELLIVESYHALVESFGRGNMDLVNFGGFTFIQAKKAHNAVPLVMRDVDRRFTSYFVTRADNPAMAIEDLKDETFAFGSRLSTSGHLMPRHFLALRGITPEAFFKNLRYSGAHDMTAQWVRDGVVAAGSVNARIFREMLTDGRLEKGQLRIIWETPPYSDYVWAVQASLDKTARSTLRDAFLQLSTAREQHEEILRKLDTDGFLPASMETFSDLETIALKMGLL